MTDTPSILVVKDANATSRNLGTMLDGGAPTQYPQNVLRANSAPVSTANPLPTFQQGRLAVAPIANTVLASSLVLKATPGSLLALNLNSTATGWFLLFDATAAPADGAVIPLKAWQFIASTPRTIDVSFSPALAMANGIVVVFSNGVSPFIKAASASALISGEVI